VLVRAVGVVATVLALAGAGPAAAATRADTAAPPHVTFFGDSVAEGIVDNPKAKQAIAEGFDMRFEVAPCRRVDQLSCPYNGVRPPNVVDVLNELGTGVGPNVVVAVGYNDFIDQYATNIETAVTLMERLGVKRIFWLTLHIGHSDYQIANDAILAAAARHKSLIPVDWNTYSQGHQGWFQDDGIHLDFDGAVAMATLVHTSLARLLLAPPAKSRGALRVLTTRLPDAQRGKRYGVRLNVTGGRKPYFWTLPRKLPPGLTLRTLGWLGGVPRAHAGTYAIVLRVRDAAGATVTRRFTLRIRP
jgi:lysophospholipase L1-like esterase